MPRDKIRDVHFALYNQDVVLATAYPVDIVNVNKERAHEATESACADGQQISDTGSRLRAFSIRGLLRGDERDTFDAVLDAGDTFELISVPAMYEVWVDEGRYEGPVATDGRTGHFLYEFELNLMSSGRDEPGPFVLEDDSGSGDSGSGVGGAGGAGAAGQVPLAVVKAIIE